MNTVNENLRKLKISSQLTHKEVIELDKEIQLLLNDPATTLALREFKDLCKEDKQEIINFIKFKKQQNK